MAARMKPATGPVSKSMSKTSKEVEERIYESGTVKGTSARKGRRWTSEEERRRRRGRNGREVIIYRRWILGVQSHTSVGCLEGPKRIHVKGKATEVDPPKDHMIVRVEVERRPAPRSRGNARKNCIDPALNDSGGSGLAINPTNVYEGQLNAKVAKSASGKYEFQMRQGHVLDNHNVRPEAWQTVEQRLHTSYNTTTFGYLPWCRLRIRYNMKNSQKPKVKNERTQIPMIGILQEQEYKSKHIHGREYPKVNGSRWECEECQSAKRI
ncbi:hypothetical protein B0H13DRAFT_1861369 [Mycena leptocephala]|nr:hypothetical protein B0H13DRAFT_1861369 [Mycena leptocephala]